MHDRPALGAVDLGTRKHRIALLAEAGALAESASSRDAKLARELALPLGLVDNKVCAIDEIWSVLNITN